MDPTEFLRFAEKTLCCGTGKPVECRNAISRAYYAAFLLCRSKLEAVGVPVAHGPQGHNDVRSKLQNSEHQAYVSVGRQLGDLYSKRLNADYDLGRPDVESAKTARFYVDLAGRAIAAVSGLDKDPNRDKIVAAIRAFASVSATRRTP